MRCSKCGIENPVGKKFCGDCGAPLANLCPKCGADNPAGKRFCGECGAQLAPTAANTSAKILNDTSIRLTDAPVPENIDGERKTVTALFADIKGSTELERDLDPEEARTIVDPALNLMIEAVRHYEGYVVQSTGDGVFALFGAPAASEDHPQLALYAAMRMQDDVRRYSDQLRSQGRPPLQIRIGVNTGEVVLRSLQTGNAKTEYNTIGHPVNLASRMQSLANPGSTVIAESTRKLVEGFFALKALGEARVKGVLEPVAVYEVTGLGPLRTRFQRSAGHGYTKFVGRRSEIGAIKAAAERVQAGSGQIVATLAEAGVGKSRLLFEFKAMNSSGWLVLETFSVSHGKTSAYFPVIELLRAYFGIDIADDSRKRREKVTGRVVALDRSLEDTLPYMFDLLRLAEGDDPLAQMDGQMKKRHALEAIKRILLRESLNQPLMVIFEDLHWIDEETQALLNLLADSIGTSKILLLVNYRPEYSHQWGSKTYYTQLRLDPLGRESANEMLTALLGDAPEMTQLKHVIIERTEGNPFFIEETVQVLLDEKTLVRDGSTVRLARPVAELKIPPTVHDILASRIDRLPPDEKDLLQTLAAIGSEFAFSIVQRVAIKPRDELFRMLNDLQLAEFIYEKPTMGEIEYTFKHALTQEVAYKSVLTETRKRLHERIASAMETAFAQTIDDHLIQIAQHYSRSSNTEKMVEYLERAGMQAMKRNAFREAEVCLKRAIVALSAFPETPERIDREFNLNYGLWYLLGVTSGPFTDESVQAVRRLRELSEKSSNPDRLTLMLLSVWIAAFNRGEMTAAQQIGEQIQQIAERTENRVGLTLAHAAQGTCFLFSGKLTQAMQHYDEEASSYREADFSGSPLDLHLPVLVARGWLLWHLGKSDQGRAKLRDAILLSGQSKPAAVVADALKYAGLAYLDLREPGEVLEAAEHLATVAEQGQLASHLVIALACRGWAMAELGKAGEGTRLIREGLDLAARHGSGLAGPVVLLTALSDAQQCACEWQEALTTAEQAFAAVGEQHVYLAGLLWRRGQLHFRLGDQSKATADFLEAIAVARRLGSKAYELRATTSLARLLAKQGKLDEARAMLAGIYNSFTEGFDTPDLKDAGVLLDQLKI